MNWISIEQKYIDQRSVSTRSSAAMHVATKNKLHSFQVRWFGKKVIIIICFSIFTNLTRFQVSLYKYSLLYIPFSLLCK